VIVFTVAIGLAAWINRDLIRLKIASVYIKVPPKAGSSNPPASVRPAALQGDAPWALSALPECLTQTSESTGNRSYVLAHLPAGASRVAPPESLTYGDCTISIVDDEAYVRRGEDRFHIPPPSTFYRASGALALLRGANAAAMELRVYQPVQP